MSNTVSIVGMGALTSIGLDAASTAAAVEAGISGFDDHPYMINQEGDPFVVAMVPTIKEDVFGTQRFADLAIPAIDEVLLVIEDRSIDITRIAIVFGLPEPRKGLPDDLPKQMIAKFKQIGREDSFIKDILVVSGGHSAGLMALEKGRDLILDGSREFCIVGGVDSYIEPDTLDWIEDNEQLHTPTNAWGFIPGEAAGFCLICSEDTAEKYKFKVKAKLVSLATASEPNKIKTKTVCIGEGLTRAMRKSLEALPENCKIDYTICDQNGEAYRADEYGFTLTRLSEKFTDPSDFLAPADCWGDVGAASGPLFINLVTAAAEYGYSKGSKTLIWTSSEGGKRASAILQTDNRDREVD